MADQERQPNRLEPVRDRKTGREVARFDRSTERMRLKDGRENVWIDVRELLDRKPKE